ncbi:methionine ABC transporter permease [Methylobrevis albus]|uniref:ABC transporter permease n=1 Tax=Methylobrevis albus TaxID=2793297 RepID=A0A931I3S9_9HYPH|nr:methionine ABC transporter permease [Methylobrevis albus]MBH0238924.1 ABC transporter permease [Methylobrevis albus]
MSGNLLDLFWIAMWETAVMVGISGAIALAAGLPIGLILVATAPGGIFPAKWINWPLGGLVNAIRSTPFIILLVAMIPLTRLIVGTTIGLWAAIVPLSIAAAPFFARLAEVALREVHPGLIEAARAMGATRAQILRHVLLPEALPGIVGSFTITIVSMINSSAMAGAVGAGGLGDLAMRFGYQRFDDAVMAQVVVVLIAVVTLVQWSGDALVRRLDRR